MKIWIEKLSKHKNKTHYQSVSTTKFIFVSLFVVTPGGACGVGPDTTAAPQTSVRADSGA